MKRGAHLVALAFAARANAQNPVNWLSRFGRGADPRMNGQQQYGVGGPQNLQVGPMTLEGGGRGGYGAGVYGNVQIRGNVPADYFCPKEDIDCDTCPEPGLLTAPKEPIRCLASAGEDGRRRLQVRHSSRDPPPPSRSAFPSNDAGSHERLLRAHRGRGRIAQAPLHMLDEVDDRRVPRRRRVGQVRLPAG